MATRAASLSRPDSQGHFHRQLGWKVNASGKRVQHKFRFGRDRSAAEIRETLLRRFWEAIEISTPAHQRATWTTLTLQIASQIAKGAERIMFDPLDDSETPAIYRRRLQIYQDQYPFLRFEPSDRQRYKRGLTDNEMHLDGVVLDGLSEQLTRRRMAYEKSDDFNHPVYPTEDQVASVIAFQSYTSSNEAKQTTKPDDGKTLHQAFDAYIEWIKEEYYQPDSEALSDYGHTRLGHFKTLKERHDECPLTEVNFDKVEAMYRYWRRRPVSNAHARKGKPISRNTARHMLGALGQFFKWLNRSQNFIWRKPDGFEDLDKTIHVPASELKGEIRQVNLFQIDELVTLNRFATIEERIYLMLGLNCGFGPKEIATLTIGECFLNQGLPKVEQELFDFPTTVDQSFISLVRNKTTILGKYLLFAQTAGLLQDVMQKRMAIPDLGPDAPLLLDPKLRPLDYRSPKGNPSRHVSNSFGKLKKRCETGGVPVSDLPFKCLRKTAGDLIRRFGDGEVSGIFLLHGSAVEKDKLADIYTNRPFGKVYRAIQEVENYLAPVFEASPTPLDEQPQAYTPRSIIDLITELHSGGASIREIEAKTSLSKSTIHRHLKKIAASKTNTKKKRTP